MTKLNTRTKRTVAIVVLMILLAMFFGNIRTIIVTANETVGFAADGMRSLIYICLFAVWGLSTWHRIIQTQVRRYLAGISALMVVWMLVRSMKFLFFNGTAVGRYCWYLYYFPMLFIPVLVLFVALSLGKPENFRMPKWSNFAFFVSTVFLAVVLTNDLHQCVFSFHRGLLFFENSDYSHEFCYFIVMSWIGLCAGASLGFMIAKSHVPGSKKRIYLPCVFLLVLVTYSISYMIAPNFVCRFFSDMTIISCLLITAALESCIQCGLIQSNTHYNELFRGCGISAVIVDNDYNVQYTTATDLRLSREQMQAAEQNSVDIGDGTILESMSLGDGHIFWLEDVSELRNIQQNLESNAAILSEEAELLAEEVRQKEEKAVTDIRNRLYNTVAKEIAPQIAEINRLISHRPKDTEAQKKTMKKMCVLGAYVKRRCNLIFLNEQQKTISSMELYNCLQESAEYIIQYGIPCSVDNVSQGNVLIENAKLAYDYFEAVAENAMETLTGISVYIIATEGSLVLRLSAEGEGLEFCDEVGVRRDIYDAESGGVAFCSSELCRRIEQAHGRTETDYEDGVWHSTLILPEGGTV